MSAALTLSTSGDRSRSAAYEMYAAPVDLGNCHVNGWLGGHDVSAIGVTVTDASLAGAMGYFPKTTTAKRTSPGTFAGGLT